MLHHLSIKRAIQVLRINNFEPNCLRRRPSDEVLHYGEAVKRNPRGLSLVFDYSCSTPSSCLLILLYFWFPVSHVVL